jgi:hypothetical protein
MSDLIPINAPQPFSALSRRSDLVANTLEDIERAEIFKFFVDCPELIRESIENHYPLTQAQLARYVNRWDWHQLSQNKAIPWSGSLLKEFSEFIDFGGHGLCRNPAVPWSSELLDSSLEYLGDWAWFEMSSREAMPWSEDLIDRYAQRWNWRALSSNLALPWSQELIERFELPSVFRLPTQRHYAAHSFSC